MSTAFELQKYLGKYIFCRHCCTTCQVKELSYWWFRKQKQKLASVARNFTCTYLCYRSKCTSVHTNRCEWVTPVQMHVFTPTVKHIIFNILKLLPWSQCFVMALCHTSIFSTARIDKEKKCVSYLAGRYLPFLIHSITGSTVFTCTEIEANKLTL